MTRYFFYSAKRLWLPVLFLLAVPLSVPAQNIDFDAEYYENPVATHVAYLPDEVAGTSSLFFFDGRLWTANDHGTLRLFSINPHSGAVDSIVDLGVKIHDLEEVTLDEKYLYFGDIGDNKGSRAELRILRLAQDDLRRKDYRFDTIRFSYPDRSRTLARNFDCEAFVATADSLYLFTKQWISHNTICYAVPKTPGTYVAERRFKLHTDGLVTGACYLPELRTLAFIGYSLLVKPFVYLIDGFDGARFDQGRHRRIPLDNIAGNQMEGIASLDGLHFFLTRETLSLRLYTRRTSFFTLDLTGLPLESNVR